MSDRAGVAITSDKAGTWQRVSTGGQDEASQLPDLARWCETHEYAVKANYVLHGKSASKGKQDAALDEVIRDMQDGKINVLVVWQSSRIERRGAYNAFDLARRVREAGGRIEYVKDAYLNETNEMSDVMLALAATKDRQKSRDISLQVLAKQTALREAGSVVGRAPWGYVNHCTVCDKLPARPACNGHRKIITPTADGRKYIPVIFQMIVDGKSSRDVASYLTDEGVDGKKWNEAHIGNRIIKNSTYYGVRPNSGNLETEALVSYSTWQEANAKLSSRARPGRSTVKREKALVSSVCGNPECDATGEHPSPMYRIKVGKPLRDKFGDIMYRPNGQPFGVTDYYRCTGRGPQRKGCGHMVPVAEIDRRVIDSMLSDETNHAEREFVAGDDRSDEIGKLRESAMTAYRQGNKALFFELDAQADELAAKPNEPAHWETRPTGLSEAEHFASLDSDGQREFISAHKITVWRDDDGQPVVIVGPRDWTD